MKYLPNLPGRGQRHDTVSALAAFISILVVSVAVITGCQALSEVGEAIGTKPTKPVIEGPTELEKAGQVVKDVGTVVPPPVQGWMLWGAGILTGLGHILQEKRRRAALEAIAAVHALKQANNGNADFSDKNAAILSEMMSDGAKLAVKAAKARVNPDMVNKLNSGS